MQYQYILKNEAVRSFRRVQGKSKPGFHDLVPITAPQNDKGPKAHRIPGSFFVTYRATRDFEITEYRVRRAYLNTVIEETTTSN